MNNPLPSDGGKEKEAWSSSTIPWFWVWLRGLGPPWDGDIRTGLRILGQHPTNFHLFTQALRKLFLLSFHPPCVSVFAGCLSQPVLTQDPPFPHSWEYQTHPQLHPDCWLQRGWEKHELVPTETRELFLLSLLLLLKHKWAPELWVPSYYSGLKTTSTNDRLLVIYVVQPNDKAGCNCMIDHDDGLQGTQAAEFDCMIGHNAGFQSDTGRRGSGTYNSDFSGTWTVTLFQI
jgi:hypothetical protein